MSFVHCCCCEGGRKIIKGEEESIVMSRKKSCNVELLNYVITCKLASNGENF